MPFTTRIDSARNVSYVRMSDTVTFDDLAAAQRALASDLAFDPTFPLLLDLQTATDVRLTWQEIPNQQAVALSFAELQPLLKEGQTIVVTDGAGVGYD